jgi:hypothetical protein
MLGDKIGAFQGKVTTMVRKSKEVRLMRKLVHGSQTVFLCLVSGY